MGRHTNSQRKELFESFLFLKLLNLKYIILFIYILFCFIYFVVVYSSLFIPFIISIGIGKTIVEFFSAAIEVRVCKYLKCPINVRERLENSVNQCGNHPE